jgi:hypothetical protein
VGSSSSSSYAELLLSCGADFPIRVICLFFMRSMAAFCWLISGIAWIHNGVCSRLFQSGQEGLAPAVRWSSLPCPPSLWDDRAGLPQLLQYPLS